MHAVSFSCKSLSHFHKNGIALRLALKQRLKGTRKSPVANQVFSRAWLFHFLFCFLVFVFYTVPRPLGMESGAIKDSQINASSETENGTRDQSRLNSGPEKAWCVQESDSIRTLTINLTKPYYITQVTFPTEKEQSLGKIM